MTIAEFLIEYSSIFQKKIDIVMERQPKSLSVLFFSESIQRFGAYGIQSILLLFLLKKSFYSVNLAYTTYGIFTALSFILAILGGLLADKYLGFRKVVFLGIILSLIGNVILALNIGNLAIIGLTCTLLEFGLFLPNNSSLLGSFYQIEDSRRSRGFTLFYIGTNIGGILGPVIYGILSIYGWHFPFIISAFFLISWILFYLSNQKYFKNHGEQPKTVFKHAKLNNILSYAIISVLFFVVIFLLKNPVFAGKIITIVGIVSFLVVAIYALRKKSQERNKIFLLILMIFCALIFFSSVFQIYTSLLLFIDHHIQRKLMGWLIPSPAFTSLEPFFIVILAPFVAYLWKILNFRKKEPLPLTKMCLGLLLGGCGFGIFALGAHHMAYVKHQISLLWIVSGNYF